MLLPFSDVQAARLRQASRRESITDLGGNAEHFHGQSQAVKGWLQRPHLPCWAANSDPGLINRLQRSVVFALPLSVRAGARPSRVHILLSCGRMYLSNSETTKLTLCAHCSTHRPIVGTTLAAELAPCDGDSEKLNGANWGLLANRRHHWLAIESVSSVQPIPRRQLSSALTPPALPSSLAGATGTCEPECARERCD